MNEEEMRKLKIDGKCKDLLDELVSRGHVKVTLEDGEEIITMTKEGHEWFRKMTIELKEAGVLPQDYDTPDSGSSGKVGSMKDVAKNFDKAFGTGWRSL